MARTVGRASIVFPVVAIAAALVLFGCGRIKETPNQLLGTWKSKNTRYKDRYLKFTPTTITFGTGEDTSLTYQIKYFKYTEKDKKSGVYDLKFEDLYGDEIDLSILYWPEKGGIIKVGQIEATWYRSQDEE